LKPLACKGFEQYHYREELRLVIVALLLLGMPTDTPEIARQMIENRETFKN
jgi:hypothetical protein